MSGKASLIMVVGFAVLFSFMNLKMLTISSKSVLHVIGYNQSSLSRNAAIAGANLGLAKLTENFPQPGVLVDQTYTSGPFKGVRFYVRIDHIEGSKPYLRLRSVSFCTTAVKKGNSPVILMDTVEINFENKKVKSFSTFGWMTVVEGNVFFVTGDTLWGKVHTNGNIHMTGKPVFWNKVTVSGKLNPALSTNKKKTENEAIFKAGYEEGVQEHLFPDDLSEIRNSKTNVDSTQDKELWVELFPGTPSNNDGYAIVRRNSFSGPVVDRINLSDASNNVIYSTKSIHVKGILDGRLSIGTEKNIRIEGNITYERPPDPTKPLSDPANQTGDILGLIANENVQIAGSYHGDINLHACIFARTGSFEADNWNGAVEGRIRLIGSITQHTRGRVGQSSNNKIISGYSKSYRYDPRLADGTHDAVELYPPSFPGFSTLGPLKITNWWESMRPPFDINDYN